MKLLLTIISLFALTAFVADPATITKKERKTAVKFLKDAEKTALKTVAKLSDAQLKFKPGPDRWSVEECMMHIAATEKMLWGIPHH